MISSGKATLTELDTVLSVEDVYDLVEVITIDAYNRKLMTERDNQS